MALDEATWQSIATDRHLWTLIDRNILRVAHVARGQTVLQGMSYVGRTRLGCHDIHFVEKQPGALAALFGYATHGAFKVESLPQSTSSIGPLAELLLQQFVSTVRQYCSQGRDWEYRQERELGSLVGGRIDVTASLKLRARGLGHRIAFDRPVVSFATGINRLVAAALSESERIGAILGLSPEGLQGSRAVAMLFADSRDPEVVFGERARLAEMATTLSLRDGGTLKGDMLALASVLLLHESFEFTEQRADRIVPRSWFLNLETLFEAGVRRVLTDILGKEASVRNGRLAPPPIFSAEVECFSANPDLVIKGEMVWIGDVKYKQWAPGSEGNDLYQVLAHASAHEARIAFLVYVDDEFQIRDLGSTRDGIRTILVAVNPKRLDRHLLELVANLRGTASVRFRI